MVTPEEWSEREPAKYGFNEADEPTAYPVGTTDDHKYWASDYTLPQGDHRRVHVPTKHHPTGILYKPRTLVGGITPHLSPPSSYLPPT